MAAPTKKNADAINGYNTELSPEDETAFQTWAANKWGPTGSDTSRTIDDVLSDYDMRGFYMSGDNQGGNGHFPDTYKKPNHPTFSTESKYSNEDHQGGEWVQTDKEKDQWTFQPGPENLKNHTPAQLQSYFDEVEPDSQLLVPPANQLFPNSNMAP